jgi:hypothetical protein
MSNLGLIESIIVFSALIFAMLFAVIEPKEEAV